MSPRKKRLHVMLSDEELCHIQNIAKDYRLDSVSRAVRWLIHREASEREVRKLGR